MPPRPQSSLISLLLVVAVTSSACGGDDPPPSPPPDNIAPVITQRPTASPSTVLELEATTLSVTATDADGDTLTYTWEQTSPESPRGTFSSPSGEAPTWTAPDTTSGGTFSLRVTVTDGRGGSVQDSVDVTVQQPNRPPIVAATITAPNSLLAGATGSFSITASDEDGDPLTYSWEQTAPSTQGAWVGARTGSSAQWYSPVVSTQVSFTLTVSVSDGRNTPVLRSVTVPVTVPRYSADIQPVWSSAGCLNCHGASGNLSLSPSRSYANLVNVNATIAVCNTLRRVSPGDADNSVLVRKMEGTACGNRMPRDNPTYFNTNPGLLVRVRSWILAGSAND